MWQYKLQLNLLPRYWRKIGNQSSTYYTKIKFLTTVYFCEFNVNSLFLLLQNKNNVSGCVFACAFFFHKATRTFFHVNLHCGKLAIRYWGLCKNSFKVNIVQRSISFIWRKLNIRKIFLPFGRTCLEENFRRSSPCIAFILSISRGFWMKMYCCVNITFFIQGAFFFIY